jgi:hypothetical protein
MGSSNPAGLGGDVPGPADAGTGGVRHTFLVPIQRWRCPAALQVKSVVVAAAGVAVAGVFFPLWFGVPVMVVVGAWGLGMAVRPAEVVVDPDSGVLVLRVGLLARRVRLASVTAVQADGAKVSVARSDGGEISLYAWGKSKLDRWLRIPVVAGQVAHAISRAAATAQEAGAGSPPARMTRPERGPLRSRQPLAVALLGATGLLAVVAAFLVRVSWPNPVMTALGAVLAIALGVSGLFYALFALWLLVTGRTKRDGVRPAGQPPRLSA